MEPVVLFTRGAKACELICLVIAALPVICRISVHVPPSASALTGCLFTWNYRTLQSIQIRKHFGVFFQLEVGVFFSSNLG